MKKYIVFDLEWNQSPCGKAGAIEHMPFEIIEIGAVSLDENLHQTGSFHRLIRPSVYHQMHYMIAEVTHFTMEELNKKGIPFKEAVDEFIKWCGEDYIFCIWGNMDLTELQRNMQYYEMNLQFGRPVLYYDIQKLYGIVTGDVKARVSLDQAVEELNIPVKKQFHRAYDDACYTGKVMSQIDFKKVMAYYSIDYYRIPADREEEITIRFPEYVKFISHGFNSKEEAIQDKIVSAIKCPDCKRALRKKVRWFTPNQKIYYCLGYCPEHGYVKSKIRMKKTDFEQIFAVRTTKRTDEAGAAKIYERKADVIRKRNEKNRLKKVKR